jgi:hypothetical protein
VSAALGLLVPFAALVVAGTTTAVVICVHERWTVWRGRRRVRAAVEPLTARRIADLVPPQRVPTDPQPRWDFVPQRDGEN